MKQLILKEITATKEKMPQIEALAKSHNGRLFVMAHDNTLKVYTFKFKTKSDRLKFGRAAMKI